MNAFKLCIPWLFLLAGPALAKETAAGLSGGECVDVSSGDQLECLNQSLKDWNERMLAAFNHDREQLRHNMGRHPDYAGEQKIQLDHLEKSQTLWLKFRAAYCDIYTYGNGEQWRIHTNDCLIRLTASRAQELEQMLEP